MPSKKGATKMKKKPTKSTARSGSRSTSKAKVGTFSRKRLKFSRVQVAAFIVVFAAIGSYLLFASFADTPGKYLVGMGSAGAIAASQDPNGDVTLTGSGAALGFQVSTDNMLQCTNGEGGKITTAQLTPEQTSDIANRVIAAGIQTQSDTVVAKGKGALEGTWITVNTNGVSKTVNIIGTAQSTPFGRAVSDVARDVCKQATKPVNAKQAAAGTAGTKLSKAEGQALATKIENAINAKVYADSYFSPRSESAQYVGIKWWREQNGVTKNLKFASCLRESARIHSQRQAEANTMSHQLPGEPDFAHRINNNCDPAHWVWAGENVAWNSDMSMNGVALLIDLMAAEKPPENGHRLNDLSTHYDYVGAGAYYDSVSGKVWITNDFASFDRTVSNYDSTDDWNLNGSATVSLVADNLGGQTVSAKPGQNVYYHYRIANVGPTWAHFNQYRIWRHYGANGSLVNSSDEHAEYTDSIGWGVHGGGFTATATNYAFGGRYYDDFKADTIAVTIPSTAQNGEKFCRLIHYNNATGPSTGTQNSNEACAVVQR